MLQIKKKPDTKRMALYGVSAVALGFFATLGTLYNLYPPSDQSTKANVAPGTSSVLGSSTSNKEQGQADSSKSTDQNKATTDNTIQPTADPTTPINSSYTGPKATSSTSTTVPSTSTPVTGGTTASPTAPTAPTSTTLPTTTAPTSPTITLPPTVLDPVVDPVLNIVDTTTNHLLN